MTVYFAQTPYGGPIKVGFSCDPRPRLKNIAREFPFELVEIGSFPGARFRERFVQCWFRAHHIKGEWFEPTAELWRWGLEARTTGHIHIVPDEPTGSVSGRIVNVRIERWGLTREQIASTAGTSLASVASQLQRPVIRSAHVLAAVAVLATKKGFEWKLDMTHSPDFDEVAKEASMISTSEEAA